MEELIVSQNRINEYENKIKEGYRWMNKQYLKIRKKSIFLKN